MMKSIQNKTSTLLNDKIITHAGKISYSLERHEMLNSLFSKSHSFSPTLLIVFMHYSKIKVVID